MKKAVSYILILFLVSAALFAQKQIGTISKENVFFVTAVKGKPVYAYYEFNDLTGRQTYISYNNIIFGPYNYLSNYYDFNENRIALLTEKDDGKYLFINGKEYGPYVVAYADKFISDTEYVYHVADKEPETDDEWWNTVDVYINGKHYPNVKNIIKSSKGLEARVVRDNSKEQYFVELNNKKYGPYESELTQIDFLSDGKTLIYKAQKKYSTGYKNCFAINGKETGPFDIVGQIKFSSDKKHYAFFYQQDYRYTLIKDGQTLGTYDDLFSPEDYYDNIAYLAFIPDSDKLCFIEHNQDDSYTLNFGEKIIENIEPWSLKLYKDYCTYFKSGNYPMFDVYINDTLVQKNVFNYYTSVNDKNDYAYVFTKTVSGSELNNLYGGLYYEPEKHFEADSLFYKDKEYLLSDLIEYAYILNKEDIFYITNRMNTEDDGNTFHFYLNGNMIYELSIPEFATFYNIYQGNDFCYFSINGKSLIYYNGKFYTGYATEKQIVYLDQGKIYLKN